jgi:hypothetical protein
VIWVPRPTALPAVYPFNRHSPEIYEVALHRVPMNLAMSLLIGILSIATATMWLAAFALWLRSSTRRSTPSRSTARPTISAP